MPSRITIDRRFCGPPDSGNGGYACGALARLIEAPTVTVTLRLPPPLETPLRVERRHDRARLLDDGKLIAQGSPARGIEIEPPGAVPLEAAAEASRSSPLHRSHPFPTCFVCGPRRDSGDGLRIIPGPVAGRDLVAAPWVPGPSLPTEGDAVAPEICWAALDCPSGNALMLLGDVGTAVLGRLTARLYHPVRVGAPHALVGWPIARDERKVDAASALFSADGKLAGLALARWIELRTDDLT
jgi:hypothetical protein